jgi:HEAT repeat protein
MRIAVVTILTMFCGAVVGAAETDMSAVIKALSDNDKTAEIKATDEVIDIGPKAKAATPVLMHLLDSDDADVRWHAARALAEIGPGAKAAVPVLLKALKDENPMVRGYAADALEQIRDASKPVVIALADLLEDKDHNVRRRAIDAIVGIHPEPQLIVPILKKAIEDAQMDPSITVPAMEVLAEMGDAGMPILLEELRNEKSRYWACVALASCGSKAKAAVPDLEQLLAHAHPEMRMQAAMALAAIGPDAKAAVPALMKALSDDQNAVRYGASYALGQIGAKEATEELKKQESSEDEFLRMISIWAVAKVNPDDTAAMDHAVGLLVESLKSPNQRLRAAAARGLLELKAPREKVAEAMSGLMAEKDPMVQAHVVEALSTLGEAAVPRLIKALQNDELQSLAVAVIRRLGPTAKDAVPALIEELKDPQADYRREVEFALAAIGPDARAAVPALVKEMDEDEDPKVRRTACYALGKIGPDAADAVGALRKQMESDDAFMRVASLWALLQIQPKDQPLRRLAVKPLTKALEESDKELVKIEVSRALGDLGALAKESIPALEKAAAEDESPAVRAAAAEALKKVKQS